MRLLARWISHTRQTGPVVCLLLVLVGSGCDTSLLGSSREDQISQYESSLRAEADWLWNNMNYALTHYQASQASCREPNFRRKSVALGPAERKEDATSAYLIDHLDYAARLIDESHTEWTRFCRGETSASHTASYIEARLRPAYNSMNLIRLTYHPQAPTPVPGSG